MLSESELIHFAFHIEGYEIFRDQYYCILKNREVSGQIAQ